MMFPWLARRQTLMRQAEFRVRYEVGRLAAAGLACPVVSGGGTGTADFVAGARVVTELQAGSYVLLDAAYAAIGLPFEPALYCVATLISRRASSAGTLDAGLKQLAVDQGLPRPVTDGFSVLGLSDEHARIALDATSPLAVGDKVFLMPAHVDSTINLHDVLYVIDGDGSVRCWSVDGRRLRSGLDLS